MSSTNPHISELKRAQDALETKLEKIIQRHPALRRAAHDMKMAQLKARKAELQRTIDTLGVILGKAVDRLLYLPRGRVGGCPSGRPYVEFNVTEKTEALLNSMVVSGIEKGNPTWLDLAHDSRTRLFDISHFKLEPGGLYAHGNFTALGKRLRDSGRISAVSATIYSVFVPGEPVFAFGGFDFSIPPVHTKSAEPMTLANLAIMGGVLLDGAVSAYQPIKK